jgi:hypothetical protein
MQNQTGCKINVSPASGRDIEREIGLIGSRYAIDAAKRAIMEKVDTVVGSPPMMTLEERMLTRHSALARKPVKAAAMTMQTVTQDSSRNSPHMCLESNLQFLQFNRPCHRLWLGRPGLQILMLLTAAIRTTFRCGMPPWLPNSNNQVAQVQVSNDEAC